MKKSVWIFLLAVFLPGAVLGWLALRGVEEQQIVFERRTAELYQKETEALSASVRDAVEAERRGFGDAVHRLLASNNPRKLAEDFTNTLSDVWPRKVIGFALNSSDGMMLSPSSKTAAANPEWSQFIWNDGPWLCNAEVARPVYITSRGDANGHYYGNTFSANAPSGRLAQNQSPSPAKPESSAGGPPAPNASYEMAKNDAPDLQKGLADSPSPNQSELRLESDFKNPGNAEVAGRKRLAGELKGKVTSQSEAESLRAQAGAPGGPAQAGNDLSYGRAPGADGSEKPALAPVQMKTEAAPPVPNPEPISPTLPVPSAKTAQFVAKPDLAAPMAPAPAPAPVASAPAPTPAAGAVPALSEPAPAPDSSVAADEAKKTPEIMGRRNMTAMARQNRTTTPSTEGVAEAAGLKLSKNEAARAAGGAANDRYFHEVGGGQGLPGKDVLHDRGTTDPSPGATNEYAKLWSFNYFPQSYFRQLSRPGIMDAEPQPSSDPAGVALGSVSTATPSAKPNPNAALGLTDPRRRSPATAPADGAAPKERPDSPTSGTALPFKIDPTPAADAIKAPALGEGRVAEITSREMENKKLAEIADQPTGASGRVSAAKAAPPRASILKPSLDALERAKAANGPVEFEEAGTSTEILRRKAVTVDKPASPATPTVNFDNNSTFLQTHVPTSTGQINLRVGPKSGVISGKMISQAEPPTPPAPATPAALAAKDQTNEGKPGSAPSTPLLGKATVEEQRVVQAESLSDVTKEKLLGGVDAKQAVTLASSNTVPPPGEQLSQQSERAWATPGDTAANGAAVRNVAPLQVLDAPRQAVSSLVPDTASFRTITSMSDEGMVARFVQDKLELIYWVRPPEDRSMIFGCLVEPDSLKDLWTGLVAQRQPTVDSTNPAYVLALLDDKARPVASLPAENNIHEWKRPFVANEIGEALPHWEAALYLASPGALAESASGFKRTLSFTVAAALAIILIGAWLVVADIRRQLALAQQKTDFVSNVSHELKTPLTSIRMFAELMHDRPPPAEKQGQYLRIITVEAERLTRLINNVLDFAKLERRQKRFDKHDLELHAVIARVWDCQEMHLRDAGFTTRWQAAPAPYRVQGDEDALAQVLVNLLSNAEKYSLEKKEVELHSWTEDGWLHISVLDRGMGVPSGEERKIFDSFYRAHDSLSSGIQGSGLGLTLAQRLAQEHGGRIEYSRREGGGSRFTLLLPLVEKPVA